PLDERDRVARTAVGARVLARVEVGRAQRVVHGAIGRDAELARALERAHRLLGALLVEQREAPGVVHERLAVELPRGVLERREELRDALLEPRRPQRELHARGGRACALVAEPRLEL